VRVPSEVYLSVHHTDGGVSVLDGSLVDPGPHSVVVSVPSASCGTIYLLE
jgi:hypothetical protein